MLSDDRETDGTFGRTWPLEPGVRGAAVFSRCGAYRPYLSRRWGAGGMVMWLCMNPSAASDRRDDATSRKLTRHSRRLGFGGLFLLNVMDFRATDPARLPAGRERSAGNLRHIARCARLCDRLVIACGGLRGKARWLSCAMEALDACGDVPMLCVAVNGDGAPRHPRVFRGDFVLRPFRRARWPSLAAPSSAQSSKDALPGAPPTWGRMSGGG